MLEKTTLTAGGGYLRTPGGVLLTITYDAGDCDTISWPPPAGGARRAEWRRGLMGSLYDARECGLIPNVREVSLPDGAGFGIDAGWWVGLPRAIRATPITGRLCFCRPGQDRDNCPRCEGTGMAIDFAALRAANLAA